MSDSQPRPVSYQAARRVFVRRLLLCIGLAGGLVAVSLAAGVAGYHFLEGMSWMDAFVNASMILSGMGPVTELHTEMGKLFAGCYALYSGLAVILATGLILAPVIHFVLHRFHLESKREE
ncbi:MAG: hypothetical protein WD845_05095 [Pirellulales bacterium]